MPRRRIDRRTGEPKFTLCENKVDEHIANCGKDPRAVAGYSPSHADQAASRVGARPDFKERVRRSEPKKASEKSEKCIL